MGNKPRSIVYVPQVIQRFETPKVLGGRKSAFIIKSLRDLIKSRTLTPHRQLMAIMILLYCHGVIDFINSQQLRPELTTPDDKGVREPEILTRDVLDVSIEFDRLLKDAMRESSPTTPKQDTEQQ
jgi:hypothetical protein